jgi:hypothetical protein
MILFNLDFWAKQSSNRFKSKITSKSSNHLGQIVEVRWCAVYLGVRENGVYP